MSKLIAQLVAYWLGTGEVPGSNPGLGENFSMKIIQFQTEDNYLGALVAVVRSFRYINAMP